MNMAPIASTGAVGGDSAQASIVRLLGASDAPINAPGRCANVEPMGVEGATSRLFRVTLACDGNASGGPKSLVAKLPHEGGAVLEIARRFRLYEREARFYRDLAPSAGVPVPRLYACARNEAGDFELLLEDLAPGDAGDVESGADADTLAEVIDVIAATHASFWADEQLSRLPWLPRPDAPVTVDYALSQYPAAWRGFRRHAPSLHPDVVVAGERLCGDTSALERMSREPCTLTHGDLRMNNLVFRAGRLTGILDWQSVTRARGPGDLAALLIGNLRPEECARSEARLVRRYHERLLERGIGEYSFDECWTDYRLAALAQFASVVMQSAFIDLVGNRKATMAPVIERPLASVSRLRLHELLPGSHRPARAFFGIPRWIRRSGSSGRVGGVQ